MEKHLDFTFYKPCSRRIRFTFGSGVNSSCSIIGWSIQVSVFLHPLPRNIQTKLHPLFMQTCLGSGKSTLGVMSFFYLFASFQATKEEYLGCLHVQLLFAKAIQRRVMSAVYFPPENSDLYSQIWLYVDWTKANTTQSMAHLKARRATWFSSNALCSHFGWDGG